MASTVFTSGITIASSWLNDVNTKTYNDPEIAALAAPAGSSGIGYTQGGTGAVARTVQTKLQEIVSVLDFGAVLNSSTPAVRTANKAALLNAMAQSNHVYIPQGVLWTDPGIQLPSGTTLRGAGKQSTTIMCDGDLFQVTSAVTSEIRITNLQLQNNVTMGKLLSVTYSGATQGITCKDVYFNTAAYHFYATSLIVNQYFYDCTFLGASNYSRAYLGGAFACHEFNTYTWNGGAGILVQPSASGQDSYGCSLNCCVFEQLQYEALQLNNNGVASIENWTLRSCHFESVSLSSPSTVAYVKLICGTGFRLFNIQFEDCDFTGAPAGLAFFVSVVNTGGVVNNINFNGGQTLGTAYLCTNLSSVNITNVGFNSGSPYLAQSAQMQPLMLRTSDVGYKVNYSVSVTGSSNVIYTAAQGSCFKVLVLAGNNSGNQTYQEWLVSYGYTGTTIANVTKIAEQKTDSTNSPTSVLTISNVGVVTLTLTGGSSWSATCLLTGVA